MGGCVVATFLAIVILQFYEEKQYQDYQIESVTIEEIQMEDFALTDYRHYLLTFHVVPFHYKHGLFVSGTPPYPNGCADSIVDFYLESATHDRMEHNLVPLNIGKGHTVEALTLCNSVKNTPDSIEVDHYSDMAHLKEVLQRGWDDPYGNHKSWMRGWRAFMVSVDKDSVQPQRIVIRFSDREIRSTVKNLPTLRFTIRNLVCTDSAEVIYLGNFSISQE